MADYPASIYTPRTVENLPGESFDAAQTKTCFAEDINNPNAEIVAIETELGLEPKGAYDDVADRLDHVLALPPGGSTEPDTIPYVDGSGVLKEDVDLLSYVEDDNRVTLGGAIDTGDGADVRLRVRDGNIKLDNGYGIHILDTGGTPRAVLALTDEDNLDISSEVTGGNLRFQAGDDAEIQFHSQGVSPSLHSRFDDLGNLYVGGELTINDLGDKAHFDPSNLTADREIELPDNDVLLATAIMSDSVVTGSRALDTNYTNSSNKTLWVLATVIMVAAASAKMVARFNDNGSTDYCANVGTGAGTPNAYTLVFQIQCLVPPGATYRLATAVVGTGSWTLTEWRERYF